MPPGLVVGELAALPAYPTKVPQSVLNAIGVFPSHMRYGGEQSVQGQEKTTVAVVRFGEGRPAFSPTILVGTPHQRIDVVIDNQTPVLHNFSTVDDKIDQNIAPGKSITVTLTFPGSGYLWFFCKYHLQDSQVGALETRP
jgi:plastocyanin